MTYVQPGLTLILILLAFALRQRDPKRKTRLITAALLVLLVWSSIPFNWLTAGTLEWWYPVSRAMPDGPVDAIVILGAGGAIEKSTREVVLGDGSYARVRHGARLYKDWRKLPIVVSGGPIPQAGMPMPLSHEMARVLMSEGVPEEMIIEEPVSRSTFENAVYSTRTLHSRGWMRIVLITEAIHMLRAEKTFRKQGVTVYSAPCRYRSEEIEADPFGWLPSPRGLSENENVLHEWIGLAWYGISGKL